jgi:hypothetical protein
MLLHPDKCPHTRAAAAFAALAEAFRVVKGALQEQQLQQQLEQQDDLVPQQQQQQQQAQGPVRQAVVSQQQQQGQAEAPCEDLPAELDNMAGAQQAGRTAVPAAALKLAAQAEPAASNERRLVVDAWQLPAALYHLLPLGLGAPLAQDPSPYLLLFVQGLAGAVGGATSGGASGSNGSVAVAGSLSPAAAAAAAAQVEDASQAMAVEGAAAAVPPAGTAPVAAMSRQQVAARRAGAAAPGSDAGALPALLLVPCRSAAKGAFPLNGTYFQVRGGLGRLAAWLPGWSAVAAWHWASRHCPAALATTECDVLVGACLLRLPSATGTGSAQSRRL